MNIQPGDRADVCLVLQILQQRVLDEVATNQTVEDMYEPYARFIFEAAAVLRNQTNDARLALRFLESTGVEAGPEEVGDAILHDIAGRVAEIFQHIPRTN